MTDSGPDSVTAPSGHGQPAYFDRLDAAEAKAWALLAARATAENSQERTLVLATVDSNNRPNARTVVLRAADRDHRRLRIHTDIRSPKAAEITANSHVEIVLYDSDEAIQVRVTGTATVNRDGDMREEAWREAPLGARVVYLVEDAPGTPRPEATSGLPAHADGGKRLTAEELEPGKANFVVLLIDVTGLDFLYISDEGHRRCQIDYVTGSATWVVP